MVQGLAIPQLLRLFRLKFPSNGGRGETIIGPSVHMEGDFAGEGNVRVEGIARGSLKTKGDLWVAPGAKIYAAVEALNATILGEVKGNMKIVEQLNLRATARVAGDVEAKNLTVESGALINGKVCVSHDRRETNLT